MERVSADQWYETETKGDGVTLIHEPWIAPFYRCNIWHVRGRDRDMLIDSGMGVISLRTHVPLVTERSLTAVASHTQFDHIGDTTSSTTAVSTRPRRRSWPTPPTPRRWPILTSPTTSSSGCRRSPIRQPPIRCARRRPRGFCATATRSTWATGASR